MHVANKRVLTLEWLLKCINIATRRPAPAPSSWKTYLVPIDCLGASRLYRNNLYALRPRQHRDYTFTPPACSEAARICHGIGATEEENNKSESTDRAQVLGRLLSTASTGVTQRMMIIAEPRCAGAVRMVLTRNVPRRSNLCGVLWLATRGWLYQTRKKDTAKSLPRNMSQTRRTKMCAGFFFVSSIFYEEG